MGAGEDEKPHLGLELGFQTMTPVECGDNDVVTWHGLGLEERNVQGDNSHWWVAPNLPSGEFSF